MPRRDYLLTLIEQAMQVILRIAGLRESGQHAEALNTVVDSIEKLFGLTFDDLSLYSADQLFGQLTREESPENARNKCLIFAALNREAGLAYGAEGKASLALNAFHVSLNFTLRARVDYPGKDLPAFTPGVDDLLRRLGDFPLPEPTVRLLAAFREQEGGMAAVSPARPS